MTRDEHIAWCKQRALEYLDIGDTHNAVASMLSNLTKHDETREVVFGPLATVCIMAASNPAETRRFIEGFH